MGRLKLLPTLEARKGLDGAGFFQQFLQIIKRTFGGLLFVNALKIFGFP